LHYRIWYWRNRLCEINNRLKRQDKGEKIMKKDWKENVIGIGVYLLVVAASGFLCSLGIRNVHPEDWFM